MTPRAKDMWQALQASSDERTRQGPQALERACGPSRSRAAIFWRDAPRANQPVADEGALLPSGLHSDGHGEFTSIVAEMIIVDAEIQAT